MPAKKKATDLPPQELAAPAVLRRLQMSAAKFAAQEDDAEARLAELYALSPNSKETTENKGAIARAEMDLATARDNFNKTAKALLTYDKGIATERKDGEKISVEECKEFWKQYDLSLDLAVEQLAIADSQSAALCDDPASWYVTHAENYRAAKKGAVESAITEGVLPKWILQ